MSEKPGDGEMRIIYDRLEKLGGQGTVNDILQVNMEIGKAVTRNFIVRTLLVMELNGYVKQKYYGLYMLTPPLAERSAR